MNAKKIFFNSSTFSIAIRIIEWIISGAIGAVFASIFIGQYIWSIAFAISLLIILIIYIVLSNQNIDKYDILHIMRNELNAGNYRQVIMLGYPLSRPLHLSGRYTLRYKIGEIIKQACDKLSLEEIININDEKISISYIKAKIFIDDLGWTAYQLKHIEIAKDNINEGIKLAQNINNYTLVIKGYRHLLGIFDESDNFSERDYIEEKVRKVLESEEYENSFSNRNRYVHAVAEYDYAYARTLIDDDPQRALQIAERVQSVFSNEATYDMDRYVKTFGLIGNIYARYNRSEKLKVARKTYLQGIQECEKYDRSERLIRIAIDYIKLLLKIVENEKMYNSNDFEILDREELEVFKKALLNVKRIENKDYLSELKKEHKKYLKRRR